MPAHLEAMLDEVLAGDPSALALFLRRGLKTEETAKGTSSAEMSTPGSGAFRDPAEATAERGRGVRRRGSQRGTVAFIERWNRLRPPGTADPPARPVLPLADPHPLYPISHMICTDIPYPRGLRP